MYTLLSLFLWLQFDVWAVNGLNLNMSSAVRGGSLSEILFRQTQSKVFGNDPVFPRQKTWHKTVLCQNNMHRGLQKLEYLFDLYL